MFPRFRRVTGKRHTEKAIHVRAERLYDAQGHFRGQSCFAVRDKRHQRDKRYQDKRYQVALAFDERGLGTVISELRRSEQVQARAGNARGCSKPGARRDARRALQSIDHKYEKTSVSSRTMFSGSLIKAGYVRAR